jgi:hypothetical protein
MMFRAAAAALASTLAACAAQLAQPAETVRLLVLAVNPERYGGRIVRTCGPSFRAAPEGRAEWTLTTSMAGSRHPAGIRILSCGSQPRPDRNGCITGRIARRDGSAAPEGEADVVSSAAISSVWFLHAGCGARSAGASAPRREFTVAYAVSVSGGTLSAGGGLMQSGGSRETFSLRLLNANSRQPITAEVRSPAGFDRYALHARDLTPESASRDEAGRVFQAQSALLSALAHHRPATTLLLRPGGDVRVVRSRAARSHVQCARRLLDASWRALPAAERSGDRRRDLLRQARLGTANPALLLRLVMLDLPPMTGTSWSEVGRRRAEDPDRDRDPNQYSWRSEQMRLHGREVGLRIDLKRDRSSAAARLCRMLDVTEISNPATDRCSIDAFVDARDGWPIAIGITRNVEARGGGSEWHGRSFSRLAPLEGFVPPADPCGGV